MHGQLMKIREQLHRMLRALPMPLAQACLERIPIRLHLRLPTKCRQPARAPLHTSITTDAMLPLPELVLPLRVVFTKHTARDPLTLTRQPSLMVHTRATSQTLLIHESCLIPPK